MQNDIQYNDELPDLYRKFLANNMSEEEFQRWNALLAEKKHDGELLQLMKKAWDETVEVPDYMLEDMDLRLQRASDAKPVGNRVHFIRRWSWAAAVAVLLAGTVTDYYMSRRVSQQPVTVVADIAPGSNKAILTLADGSTVTLDSAGHQVIRQAGAIVQQNGGQLQYHVQGGTASVSYNVLTTPRGGQFQVKLPDGTMVWLNAASSLRYPTVFTGKERLVEITGEAYFEVTKDVRQPFKVQIDEKTAVEVLGTHFNVNAYASDPQFTTTLLEGAVRVRQGNNSLLLHPGQQVRIKGEEGMRLQKDADIDKAIAWKNGLFDFNDVQLEELMRQVARWYDIEVVYEKGIPDVEFVGKMGRDVPLSVLLKWLRDFDLHFRVEQDGRRIIITP
ncbi:FecR family protein [Chitinophaga defluvii]|uniref:FecR domain-containing protein n=1 Tax=Chitinophaga defluvii TaxID=3163343 RepID=A0ABV2TBC9_9BACT